MVAQDATARPTKSRVTAGVLAILLGGFGVHKFYLGMTGAGVTMLLIGLLVDHSANRDWRDCVDRRHHVLDQD